MAKVVVKRVNLLLDAEENTLVEDLRTRLGDTEQTHLVMKLVRAAASKSTPELLLFIHDDQGILSQPLRRLGETIVQQQGQVIEQQGRIIDLLESGRHSS